MVLWRRAHRQWKRSADEAIAPARFASERDRLAAKVAKQVWMAHGGRRWADARDEGALLLLEAMVASHLTDAVVQASLALTYLELLDDAAARTDYEDAASLAAEVQWAEKFLAPQLNYTDVAKDLPACLHGGSAGARMAELQNSLATQVTLELGQTGIAA